MTDWKKGDRVKVVDGRSIHAGKAATLEARFLGQISQRPWWTIRLDDGAVTSDFEDSLVRLEDRR